MAQPSLRMMQDIKMNYGQNQRSVYGTRSEHNEKIKNASPSTRALNIEYRNLLRHEYRSIRYHSHHLKERQSFNHMPQPRTIFMY